MLAQYPDLAIATATFTSRTSSTAWLLAEGGTGADRHCHGGPCLLGHRRTSAPILPGVRRADPGGGPRSNRSGALRGRLRQPARLLISPTSFDRLFAAKKKDLFDLVHGFGAHVTHHCCGSSRALIRDSSSAGWTRCKRSSLVPRDESLRVEKGIRRPDHVARSRRRSGWLQQATPPKSNWRSIGSWTSSAREAIYSRPLPPHPARYAAGQRPDRVPHDRSTKRNETPRTMSLAQG